MREIILVRHAKSDWPPDVDDLNRSLSERGLGDCLVASQFFSTLKDLNDFVVHTSIAKRTQQTWDEISKQLTAKPKVVVSDVIYEASLGELVAYLDGIKSKKIIMIGHNPGLARLGNYLTGEPVEKFPTLSIWNLEIDDNVHPGTGRTISRLVPRADPDALDFD